MDRNSRKARKANRVDMSKHFVNSKKTLTTPIEVKEDEENNDELMEELEDEFDAEVEPEEEGEEEIVQNEEKETKMDDGIEETDLGDIKGFEKDVIEDPEDNVKVETEVYIPNQTNPQAENAMEEENVELEVSGGAYKMLHELSLEWSCLSFDIIPDTLGALRTTAPYTLYFAAGTNAASGKKNKVYTVKAEGMCITHQDEEDEDDSENADPLKPKIEEDLDYTDPILTTSSALIPCGINRCRTMKQRPGIVGLWGEDGNVYIYDMSSHIKGVDGGIVSSGNELKSTLHHRCEGFALDWSPVVEGRLITGTLNGRIMLWEERGGEWRGSPESYMGHKSSVEDLQWSPKEADVFLSCSVDHTIRLWDARTKKQCVKSIIAHNCDVNVVNWNKINPFYIVSGGDDGELKVWDFRQFDFPYATFNWHKKAITSVEWCPHDESSFLASSEDDSISFWDISMEADREVAEEYHIQEIEQIPPQLMFLHQGQKGIKEAHWHEQIQGVVVSTAWDGMNIFQPCNF
ncbi:WD domain, G-beta repeat-containing protein [Entamoeba nuttalli P19]|uniref:Glutamate-rich WD repeat-containing protein 1 n=2 Tax=Entamoeba nuttalli TaxID=412467 RepID=K2G7N6_ENTNP|nr:WD domain, G-beta repeat-containing protein [Entamoeba nuttalli P19]EKE38456.1 WD domain, G-beta repeat-containing protein [Entamoeba nuttalli P19]|eukprot:XP_008859207.1 WD domain, G-beta repeat-containing protein [Entamoeba nuttalli P19]